MKQYNAIPLIYKNNKLHYNKSIQIIQKNNNNISRNKIP